MLCFWTIYFNTVKTEKADRYYFSLNKNPNEKGKELENATIDLFREIFLMEEENQKIVLNALRRQEGGPQYGHDLSFEFEIKDSVRENEKVICHVECKNYNRPIGRELILEKLIEEEIANSGIHYWILISPHSNPANKLEEAL